MVLALGLLLAIAAGQYFVRLDGARRAGGHDVLPAIFQPRRSLSEAELLAASQKKLVFALGTADWCGPCHSYKQQTLVNPEVVAWIDAHAITAYVDVDQSEDDARRLQAFAIPATVLMRDGEIIAKLEGFVGPDELLAWLKSAAEAPPDDVPPGA